jgi:hypothetical protein
MYFEQLSLLTEFALDLKWVFRATKSCLISSKHSAKDEPDSITLIKILPIHVSSLIDLSCLSILYYENHVVCKFRPRNKVCMTNIASNFISFNHVNVVLEHFRMMIIYYGHLRGQGSILHINNLKLMAKSQSLRSLAPMVIW